jgi:hypothetical protein
MGMTTKADLFPLNTIRTYLRESGWRHLDDDDRASTWQKTRDDDELQLVLPLVEGAYTDYLQVVREALNVVAYSERRSVGEVAADMQYGGADIVSVRRGAPPGGRGRCQSAEGSGYRIGRKSSLRRAVHSSASPESREVFATGSPVNEPRQLHRDPVASVV